MSKTVAFIPARCGSKSIPFKNIKLISGRPLIYWNIFHLHQSNEIDEIIVATDCNEIKSIVETFNFDRVKIYSRIDTNASDTSSTESVVLEYIDAAKLNSDDTFILVQATSPFTTTDHFNGGLKLFRQENIDSVLSAVNSKRFFWTPNGNPINYDFNKRPRRQDFDGMMMENGAFYINSVSNIITNKNRLSGTIACYEMPEYTALEIDEEHDWIMAESLMSQFMNVSTQFKDIKLFISDIDGVLTDAGMMVKHFNLFEKVVSN